MHPLPSCKHRTLKARRYIELLHGPPPGASSLVPRADVYNNLPLQYRDIVYFDSSFSVAFLEGVWFSGA